MSKVIVETIQPNGAIPIEIDSKFRVIGDLLVSGATGVTSTVFYGDGSSLTNLPLIPFSGNTSGSCVQELWLEYLNGCNGLLNINGDVNITGFLSANTYYGDSSNMTKQINNVIPVGSGITSVNAYLNYGINLITSADTTNFCVRLPETPIEGREVILINNSGFDIYVFPSMSGGTINGVLNGSSQIPSDGKRYTFVCYENPNPGQWSNNLNVFAAGQYDSGIIGIDTSQSTNFAIISAYDNNFKHNHVSVSNSNLFASKQLPYVLYNPNPLGCGFSSGNCLTVWFKPTTPWTNIEKITLYTNFGTGLTSPMAGGGFSISEIWEIGYYDSSTGSYLATENTGGNNYVGAPGYAYANQMIVGTASVNASGFTASPGEPGTWFGELIYSASSRPSLIGDNLLSSGSFSFTDYFGNPQNLTNADQYYSKYISFYFQSWQNYSDVQFRFLIDYNT